MNPVPRHADVAVLTILPVADQAVRRIFDLTAFDTRRGYQWAWGRLQVTAEESFVVVSGMPLDRENVAAATFVGSMIEAWRPRHLLLVDIGGAVKGREDVRLGDVVTHTNLHYYDYYKVEEHGESPRHLPLPGASSALRELSRGPGIRGDNSWLGRIGVKNPAGRIPRVLEGEMLVGGAIQSNSPRLRMLLERHPKVVAVEMEGVGAARAVLDSSLTGDVPEFLIIRGMSDFCNVQQARNQADRNRWKTYAASVAAAHAHSLLLGMRRRPGERWPTEEPKRRFSLPRQRIENLWEATRTSLFGREAQLRKLTARFSKEVAKAPEDRLPHVISGEAGMGKSVLAREVAEEVCQNYAACWWIDASDELKIRVGLREFARKAGIPSAETESGDGGNDELEAHRFLSDLRDFLEARVVGGRVFFVLDNVDDPGLKHSLPKTTLRYLPPGACDVLITSQSSRWHPVAPNPTRLNGLDLRSGMELVAEESGRTDLKENMNVEAICEAFGGRPLFLKQVAALLRDGEDPRNFKERLYASMEDVLETLPGVEGFEPLWSAIYNLSIDRANSARPGCRGLLEVIAFLAPEPVPQRLLHAVGECASRLRPAGIDATLDTLVTRSLLDVLIGHNQSRDYTLHRTIAALVRMTAREEGRAVDSLSLAISALRRSIPSRDLLRRPEGRGTMGGLAPHVEVVAEHLLRYQGSAVLPETIDEAAETCSMLGIYRRTLSEWAAAQDAHLKAVKLSQSGELPGNRSLREVRLANVLRQRGLFEQAEDILATAMPTLREHGDDRDYAWALTVKARILRARPDSAALEALPLLEEALRLLNRKEYMADPNTTRQLSELHGYISVFSRLLSKLDVAEAEAKEGLRVITGGLSPEELLSSSPQADDALVATHLRALGGIWRLRGEFGRAMQAHSRALEIFEQVYGEAHTDVGRALDSLGRVQREWGELEGALESFNRAEEISNLRFGPNYPHAGTAAVNRALVYLEMSEPRFALTEASQGLAIYCLAYDEEDFNKVNGVAPRNESTAWAIFVRANAFAELGELERARKDHQLVLEWRQHRYPDVHALTASSHYALGDVLLKLTDEDTVEQAVWHHEEALRLRLRVFGRRPDYWLAQSQARIGELRCDREMLALAHNTFSTQLKADHWRTREVAAAIAALNKEADT